MDGKEAIMPQSPRRRVNDGLYRGNSYKQYDKIGGSKELSILQNRSDTGYAVSIPNVVPGEQKGNPKYPGSGKNWNGVLIAPFGAFIKLWITEINIDFAVSGVTGQSRYRRQFFPRGFNQPVVTVSGQMPNQKEYNRLASFIRECHFEAVTGNQDLYDAKANQSKSAKRNSSASLQTISLMIKDAGPKGDRHRTRNTKGRHLPMLLEGYIKNINAGGEKFNFAPDFKFEFLPAASKLNGNIGIYEDTLDNGSDLLSFSTIFRKYGFGQKMIVPPAAPTQSSAPAPDPIPVDTGPPVVPGPALRTPLNPTPAYWGIFPTNQYTTNQYGDIVPRPPAPYIGPYRAGYDPTKQK